MNRPKVTSELNIQTIIDLIIEGKTFREISSELNIPLATLHDFASKTEHSARVKTALVISANTYADKAEEVLINARSSKNEIARAKELAQHYRWKASKRSPKDYGDSLDVTSKGESVQTTFKIGFKKPEADDSEGE